MPSGSLTNSQVGRKGRRAHNFGATLVPLRFALKILRKLVAGGLIVSYKGAHGGYALARGADQITLRQVIESVEGPYMINRCQQTEYSCTHTTSCRFHEIYDEISLFGAAKVGFLHIRFSGGGGGKEEAAETGRIRSGPGLSASHGKKDSGTERHRNLMRFIGIF